MIWAEYTRKKKTYYKTWVPESHVNRRIVRWKNNISLQLILEETLVRNMRQRTDTAIQQVN